MNKPTSFENTYIFIHTNNVTGTYILTSTYRLAGINRTVELTGKILIVKLTVTQ